VKVAVLSASGAPERLRQSESTSSDRRPVGGNVRRGVR
jgi:hypothetical protein